MTWEQGGLLPGSLSPPVREGTYPRGPTCSNQVSQNPRNARVFIASTGRADGSRRFGRPRAWTREESVCALDMTTLQRGCPTVHTMAGFAPKLSILLQKLLASSVPTAPVSRRQALSTCASLHTPLTAMFHHAWPFDRSNLAHGNIVLGRPRCLKKDARTSIPVKGVETGAWLGC